MATPVRRFALPALSGAALFFSLFVGLAGVATAHSGSVVADETCTTWSVTVSLNNDVTPDRSVDVITTIPSTFGITDGHFDTSYGQIWHAAGAAPETGTVSLDIYSGAILEFTTSAAIVPVKDCGQGGPAGQSASPDPSQIIPLVSPAVSQDAAVSPSAAPTQPAAVQLTLIKVLCPSYSVVPANRNPTTYDATGGNGGLLDTGYQTTLVNPSTDIPASCKRADGWQFGLFGGWSNGSLSPAVGSPVTTGADGAGTGSVTIALDAYEQGLAALGSTSTTGVGLWVAEFEQPGVATFGALRCYTDINNGDDIELVSGLTGAAQHVYCIAYNVVPPAATPSAFQSFQGATASAFQSFQGATATAGQGATPPPTNTGSSSSDRGSTPLALLLVGVAGAWLGLVAVRARRGSLLR